MENQIDISGASLPTLEPVKKIKKAPKVKAKPMKGIGKFVNKLISTTKLTNNEILAKVRKEFPGCKTTYACIAWYQSNRRRNQMDEGK